MIVIASAAATTIWPTASHQPPAGQYEPDHVQQKAQRARADVLATGQDFAAHDLLAERPEGEAGDAPGGPGIGQAHDRDG